MAQILPPPGMTLSQLLCAWPGKNYDEPLPNIAGFDRLAELGDTWQIRQLVDWIEPQTTCSYIMRHHGAEGLKRVLRGIALACSRNNVHMRSRTAAMAAAMDLEVI